MGNQAHRPPEGRLILIKHGMPAIVPGEPPSRWALAEEGRVKAARLAEKLAGLGPSAIVSSTEPKAIATAEVMAKAFGLTPERDACLGEQRNDEGPFTDPQTFQAMVANMFAEPGTLVMGEETANEAHGRFAAALERQLPVRSQGRLAVVSHGRIITLWISRRFGLDPMTFWLGLGLASAVVLAEDGASFELVAP